MYDPNRISRIMGNTARWQDLELIEQAKYAIDEFRADMNVLLPERELWNFEEAFHYVQDAIISKIPDK